MTPFVTLLCCDINSKSGNAGNPIRPEQEAQPSYDSQDAFTPEGEDSGRVIWGMHKCWSIGSKCGNELAARKQQHRFCKTENILLRDNATDKVLMIHNVMLSAKAVFTRETKENPNYSDNGEPPANVTDKP